jgi:galactokinase
VRDADRTDIRSPDGDVSAYVRGVEDALRAAGRRVRPCHGTISSDIPVGAGLSSSSSLVAALCLAIGAGVEPTPELLQAAEIAATGVHGGLMDQTAILGGRAGHALLLDCATGSVEHVRISEAFGFVILDTGTRRALADGRYATRRGEVEAGHPARRRHAESEQRRVYDAVDALRADDVAALGAIVSASHRSLRDDFEVSSPALDEAVEVVSAHEACAGARLMGAGFAGCVLAVAEGARVDALATWAGQRLPKAAVVRPVDGAGQVVSPASPGHLS